MVISLDKDTNLYENEQTAKKGRVLAVESDHLLQSLRASDFDIPSAIGELVDNSIQAGAKKVHIKIEDKTAGNAKKYKLIDKIICGDDGCGMDGSYESTLHCCIKLGYSTRFDDRSGIGRFGVGMTLAGIRFATKIEVYSKQNKSSWYYVHFDLNNKDDLLYGIEQPTLKSPPEEYTSLIGKDQGTLVIWSGFDKFVEQDLHSSTYDDGFEAPDSLDPYGYLNHWLGRTYRKFIWNDFEIFVNDKNVYAFDPLYINKDKNKFPDDDPAELRFEDDIKWPISQHLRKNPDTNEKSPVKIRISLLPKIHREISGYGGLQFKGRYIAENEGVSIMRNNREVLYGTIPYFMKDGKKIPWIDKDRWWGCEISFDAVLDEHFTVKNIKRGALPAKELKDALFDQIYPVRKKCIEEVEEWKKNNETKKEEKDDYGLPKTHKKAEEILIKIKTPDKPKAGTNLTKKESDSRMKHLTAELDEITQASLKAKFAAQPYTIMDSSWAGDTFVDIGYLEGKAVLKYNLHHPFFEEIKSIKEKLTKLDGSKESVLLAEELTTLLDIYIMSFVKARQNFSEEEEYPVKTILDYIVRDWGRFLESYTKGYIAEKTGKVND